MVGSVTVANTNPFEPLPLIVMSGAVVYPDPPFDMLTVAIGPVVPSVGVIVCAVPPPARLVVAVTVGADVYPLPLFVILVAVIERVAAWPVLMLAVSDAPPEPEIVTLGAERYPSPALVNVTAAMVPLVVVPTSALAALWVLLFNLCP